VEKNSRNEDESEDTYSPPAMPVGADGGIDGALATAMIGQPALVPARSPANFVCLRGPCRHYWHLVTMAQEGNPEETWAHLGIKAPRKHHHTCLVNPGFETDFGDDNAYECSKWDPMQQPDLVQLQTNRQNYFAQHPEHAPVTEENNDD
jgi:hypothetical protein